jgi:hypothetical protein
MIPEPFVSTEHLTKVTFHETSSRRSSLRPPQWEMLSCLKTVEKDEVNSYKALDVKLGTNEEVTKGKVLAQ